MKKILFPTDFSQSSENAFRYALLLADHLEAVIKVIHTTLPITDIEPYAVGTYPVDVLTQSLKKQTEGFVKSGLTQVLAQLENAPLVNSEVLLGTPVTTIVDFAKEEEVDFILMGSRGKNKSTFDKMLGSVAAGVVQNATTPVIVIPECATFEVANTLAYATNLSDADPFEIWKAVKLLSPLTKKVHVVHVRLPKENSKTVEKRIKEMQAFFEDSFSTTDVEFHMLPGLNLQKELDHFSETHKPEMMVMYQPHHSFWDKLFFKSNTKERTMLTRIPLLVQKAG